MLIDINGQNGIFACFRKRPLCFVQVVGAVDDIAYLAARTFETVKVAALQSFSRGFSMSVSRLISRHRSSLRVISR